MEEARDKRDVGYGVGSTVRIVKQPNRFAHVGLVGKVCIVAAIADGQADLMSVRLDGQSDGGGWVRCDCLVREDAPEWAEAKRLYDARIAKLHEQIMERTRRRGEKAASVGSRYKLTAKQVLEIHEEMSRE